MKRTEDTFIKVTRTEYYFIPKGSSINGWDNETVIEDWFKRIPLYSYHATRNSHKVGYSDRIENIQVKTAKEYDKDRLQKEKNV